MHRRDPLLGHVSHRRVERAVRLRRPGEYQLQAAINAVHADAVTFAHTDWPQIVALYDHLLALDPGPVVVLNRAIAVAETEGPEAGLHIVDQLGLDDFRYLHSTRAELLRRLGRTDEARDAYAARSIELVSQIVPNLADEFILARMVKGPRDYERDNPHMIQGAFHGGDRGLAQSGANRPVP